MSDKIEDKIEDKIDTKNSDKDTCWIRYKNDKGEDVRIPRDEYNKLGL